MSKTSDKRSVDMQIIAEWIEPGARVLDLGCGRGVLLDFLRQTKGISGVGVDLDLEKIAACLKRDLAAYQGDMMAFMRSFPDGHFDRVICSRTLEELAEPGVVIEEALRVARAVTVGFVNHAFWRNRWQEFFRGGKPRNAVYTSTWHESRPANPVSIADFEEFCAEKKIRIARKAHLRGDWRTPCKCLPNMFAGYALYDLGR